MKRCISAIDMGTNSFHLIIVEIKTDGTFKIVDREREVVRLGSHKGKSFGLLSEGEIEKAVDTIKHFGKIARFYGAPVRAIATSAVREAKNRDEFIDRVMEETGITVEAVDGKTEAELIYLGIKNALDVDNKKVLCVDIGGGSTEFLLGDNGNTEFAESLKLGTVRLSKMFFPDYTLSDSAINMCKKYIKDKIEANQKLNEEHNFDISVGTSGTILAAAAIIYYRRNNKFKKSLNGFSFTSSEIIELTSDVLKCKTPADRLFIEGMEIKRADVIPAGLLILCQAFETFRLKEMTVSENALREGIIVDTITKSKQEEKLTV